MSTLAGQDDKLSGKRGFALPWRAAAAIVALLHVAAFALLYSTEYTWFALITSVLAWMFVNAVVLVLVRRPAIVAVVTLIFFALLITLSRFKFEITQLTLTFLDFLLIDRDTFSFLLHVFPRLQTRLVLLALLGLPLLYLLWRTDPFRVRRKAALATVAGTAIAMSGLSLAYPEQPWEPFQGVNHISNLARSGVVSVGRLASTGWIEADPQTAPFRFGSGAHASPGLPAVDATCDRTIKRPHIIMVLDESNFDITAAPGITVPPGYRDYFKSFDGAQRTFMPEATGGPTWYTEFNVLTGLSARSFGNLKFYVTRITAGRVSRGLPISLQRCGYKTTSLYPSYGNFLGAKSFQQTAGVGEFLDVTDLKAASEQLPDSFYFDRALKQFGSGQGSGAPQFMFVYLTANHFPWTSAFQPELTPDWKPPGNTAEVDEYIRRQSMTVKDYGAFVARLKQDHPNEQFLIVRFGDHQPAISQKLIEPGIAQKDLAERLMRGDPRYFGTYYAIDTINYRPRDTDSALDTIDAAYLPIVIQDLAGVPLDASFTEQKRIMLRCNGAFYGCEKGAEARRFNRLLIDAGLIKTP